jgi:hypothetical protein
VCIYIGKGKGKRKRKKKKKQEMGPCPDISFSVIAIERILCMEALQKEQKDMRGFTQFTLLLEETKVVIEEEEEDNEVEEDAPILEEDRLKVATEEPHSITTSAVEEEEEEGNEEENNSWNLDDELKDLFNLQQPISGVMLSLWNDRAEACFEMRLNKSLKNKEHPLMKEKAKIEDVISSSSLLLLPPLKMTAPLAKLYKIGKDFPELEDILLKRKEKEEEEGKHEALEKYDDDEDPLPTDSHLTDHKFCLTQEEEDDSFDEMSSQDICSLEEEEEEEDQDNFPLTIPQHKENAPFLKYYWTFKSSSQQREVTHLALHPKNGVYKR